MSYANVITLQRYNTDSGVWETVQTRQDQVGGMVSDYFFDNTFPARWGGASYRVIAQDLNGNAVGIVSILGFGVSR